ncbi:MAG TPA: methionine--tRNA ligase, partial [Oligoflexia bacterium]|nr:methionine--tRNA ligase [Oligoflexia bacterium]
MSKKNFYITTAIDYPNGAPHMGHAYEKIITDAYARWARSSGLETYFLTGTDENGQKLAKSAEELNVPTRKFVDDNAEIFKKLCSELKISNDDFIRTTESRHSKVVGEFWRKLEKNGDVYFDRYSGLYCLACETFYTETQASDRLCPEHKTKLELLEEEGYFFKMSKYEKWIKEFLTGNPAFVAPSEARNEIVSRLNSEPLKDLSISRPNKGWGIPVPGNDKFVVYTWFDALINYYSAVVGTSHENYWPADLHVIGKDIGWFHTVIWPIMLHALGIPTPAQVYIHGMVLSEDGRKMSKSLGNGVDPFDVLKTYPLDSFRYFMLRSIPSGGNGRFSMKDLNQRHVSELG